VGWQHWDDGVDPDAVPRRAVLVWILP
jgi:hypothetical protein